MISNLEHSEREERARRLKWAREKADYKGPKAVADLLNISAETYKAHENGRNGFSTSDARAYARLFGVSLSWLYLGIGSPEDPVPTAKLQKLSEVFNRLAKAPEDIQDKVIGYAEFELSRLP